MKKTKLLFLLPLFQLFSFVATAQEYRLEAQLDSTKIMIGDYLHVKLSLNMPTGAKATIPPITQEIFDDSGIDWIASSPFDTVQEGNRTVLQQIITITSFDEGTYHFPAVPVLGEDSITILAYSDSLMFTVETIAVDTTAAIRDIHGYARVPLTFREVIPYVGITLLAVAILALIVMLIIKYQKKQKPTQIIVKPKPKEKPDVIALKALEALWLKKLWQEGHVKLYYSELTEILRVYIEYMYDIYAMEMVSAEIMEEMAKKSIPAEAYNQLKDLLQTADLVKFAKWDPLPNDHSRCFDEAKSFVVTTTEAAKKITDEPKKD